MFTVFVADHICQRCLKRYSGDFVFEGHEIIGNAKEASFILIKRVYILYLYKDIASVI